MEPEVEKLMMDAFAKNFIDYEEYPVRVTVYQLPRGNMLIMG
jgi:glutamate decarboxylase